MPSAPSAPAGVESTVGPLHLIVALASEFSCLPRGPLRRQRALRCGPGPAAAEFAARAAIRDGAGGLLVFGFAGGIARGSVCGSVVLPEHVQDADGQRLATDAAWRARLAAALPTGIRAEAGDLVASEIVVTTPAAKRGRAAATGAVALDMESAAVAAVALEAAIPFVVLKVVIDGPDDALPPDIAHWVDGYGRARIAPWLTVALRPSDWPAVWLLLRRYRVARARLHALAQQFAARDFLFAAART